MSKYSLELHYSVQNGGDGSAYPHLMESAALAEFDQANMYEGWGESCTGSFVVESDSPIVIKSEVKTAASFYIGLLEEENEEKLAEFIAEFFPEGKPTFTVKTRPFSTNDEYLYNDVYVGDKKVAQSFRALANSGEVFETLINS